MKLPKVKHVLDFDWKNADSMNAEATIEIVNNCSDLDAEVALLAAARDIDDDFGNQSINFMPSQVNNRDCPDSSEAVNSMDSRWLGTAMPWAVAACLTYLRVFPGTRVFKLTGVME